MNIDLPQDPIPARVERVQVFVTRDVLFNLEKMTKVTKQVLGKLGCDNCHSGRRLDFIEIQDFVVNPKTLDVQEVVGRNQFGF